MKTFICKPMCVVKDAKSTFFTVYAVTTLGLRFLGSLGPLQLFQHGGLVLFTHKH